MLRSQYSRHDPGSSPAVSGIEIDGVGSGTKSAHSFPVHSDAASLYIRVNLHAEPSEAVDGRETVGAGQKSGDLGVSARDGTEHDGAVGDGFIPRNSDLTS